MSRIVLIDGLARYYPDSYDSVNSLIDTASGNNGIYSTNSVDRACTDPTSSTRAALYAVRGVGQTSSIYYKFDCSEIPANANILMVSGTVKAGVQATKTFPTRYVQLCTGLTAKGQQKTVTGTNTSPSIVSFSGGNWTRAELQDLELLFRVVRTTNAASNYSASKAMTVSIFGAKVDVEYQYEGTVYQVTSILTAEPVSSIDPEGDTEVIQGETYSLNIQASSLDGIYIRDNGVDVTNQITQPQAGLYRYTLTNMADDHKLEVTTRGIQATLAKINGTWTPVTAYVKRNGAWQAVDDVASCIDENKIYMRKES